MTQTPTTEQVVPELHNFFRAFQKPNGLYRVMDLDTVVADDLDAIRVRSYLEGALYAWANCTGDSIRVGVYSKTGVLVDTVEHLIGTFE